MEPLPVVRFAQVARLLGLAARAAGLTVPGFRSPPRLPGAPRTLCRYPSGAVVAVQLRGRSFDAVVVDMIDGVIAANGLVGDAARGMRARLHGHVQRELAGGAPGRAAA